MPDKIADKTETNGATRPMPEKTAEKIEETTRRYIREAGSVTGDALRIYNDMMVTTANYYFDIFERTIRGSLEITTRAEHAMEDMLAMYREAYTEGIKSWQTYRQDISKTLPRAR